jgi:argininosuccinate lyase
MWGGRFKAATEASVEDYTQSVEFDQRLYAEDVAGSKAHARMLAARGVLTAAEAETLVSGLDAVLKEIESGTFVWSRALEDVHMNIERRLTELVGPVGGKLHTGRSRNDQVALDFRLSVSGRVAAWRTATHRLMAVLMDRAAEHKATLLPGCTHLQPAQPVSLAQHLLAYAWMLKRDSERLTDALKRIRVSPLGAAALAGTTYPVDPAAWPGIWAWGDLRQQHGRGLGPGFRHRGSGLRQPDHDAPLAAVRGAHPLGQSGFRLRASARRLRHRVLDHAQKKNPDVCELMRGKTGRVYGALTSLLTLMKGLPLAYNRDMQEDKEPFFDADRTVTASLQLMAEMLREMVFVAAAMRRALSRGFLNATELADYLAARGLPFREAHHAAGAAVALAEKRGVGLEDLSLDELRGFSPLVEQDVFQALAYETAVARRESPGGTGPGAVDRQLADLGAWLESRTAGEGGA